MQAAYEEYYHWPQKSYDVIASIVLNQINAKTSV